MKREIAAGLCILAVAASVGWKLASHPETSAGLSEIRLNADSEHSHPGSSDARARIRVRLMPTDFVDEIGATQKVPQISMAAE